jgi:hypothetical protein
MMTPLRIYADFNGCVSSPRDPNRKAVVLDTMGSLKDLCNAGVILSEGLPLIGADWSDENEDIEVHGLAQYDAGQKWWVIEFDNIGFRDVPAGNRTPISEFRCVSCQSDLTEQIKTKGLQLGDTCQHCGTPVHAPIAPPIV